MSAGLPSIFPTPLTLLQIRLYRSLCLQRDILKISFPPGSIFEQFKHKNFPQSGEKLQLKRIKSSTQIVYSTAITHKIAAQSSQSVAQITEQIADFVAEHTFGWPDDWSGACGLEAGVHDVSVQATSAGLIQVKLGDRAIAAWLNFILYNLPGTTLNSLNSSLTALQSSIPASEFQTQVFVIQHAHARCSSLLQMAQREGLITLDQSEQGSAVWQFANPESVPWLTPDFHLRLAHPSERRLICQLLAVLDQVGRLWPQPLANESFRLAKEMSQCFQVFHRDRPIWHSVVNDSTDLAQAQLGLVMATQRILYWLLNNLLGISTPSDL
jgi:hypothetical protein